jgi:hypothetical protein
MGYSCGFYADFEEHSKRSGVAIWTTETVDIYLNDEPWQVNEPPPLYYGPQKVSLLASVD